MVIGMSADTALQSTRRRFGHICEGGEQQQTVFAQKEGSDRLE